MKAHCPLRSVLDFRRFSGVGEGSQPRHSGGILVFPLRNAAKYKVIPGGKLGEKIPPNFLLRIPLAGHSGATQFPCPVFSPPAFMQGSRLQRACFAPGIAFEPPRKDVGFGKLRTSLNLGDELRCDTRRTPAPFAQLRLLLPRNGLHHRVMTFAHPTSFFLRRNRIPK
jgi:hypothetical protein